MEELGKSGEKSGQVRPGAFQPGEDDRRGRGPAPGAPNAGRPKNAVRTAALEGAEQILPELVSMALDPNEKSADRIRAAEVVGRWAGIEKLDLRTDDDEGEGPARFGVIVLPALNPRPSTEGPSEQELDPSRPGQDPLS